MSRKYKGIGVGGGIGLAKVFLLEDPVMNFKENGENKEEELKIWGSCKHKVKGQIENLIKLATEKISADKGDIFRAHLEMASDEVMLGEVEELIGQGKSCAWSIDAIFTKYQKMFEAAQNSYFKERASDIRDLKKRFLSCACNVELPDLLLIDEECIIVAHDLSPSETAMLNRKYVKGFATDIGGATSHSAIMAKTLEIPAVVSLKEITKGVKNGEMMAIDAREGIAMVGLDNEEMQEWKKREKELEESRKELEEFKKRECMLKCGTKFNVRGNIGQPKDLQKVIAYGGKGVGLFRSEFLYMESADWPTEEEQYEAYRSVLENSEGEEITIRTLDIGGDKTLNYFTFPKELNPFLGYRALRLCLSKREIFVTQLRALLKASVHGKLKIMFPMVATIDEFREAKKITKEVEEKLISEGIKVSKDYKLGMMVEIPSSAILADKFSEESEFFSVGSNDLIQYTHAADRMSEEVNYLYQPSNPSILRLIDWAIKGADSKNREVSVCGEMSSSPISAVILIGLGVKSLSMSATAIPNIKRVISQLTLEECREIARKCLGVSTEGEVLEMVKEYFRKKGVRY